MYAFCNTHDVTWGTKGDDKPENLKAATVSKDGKTDTELSFDDGDLDALYDSALQKFSSPEVPEPPSVNTADKELNYNKGFRTNVVLVWMFSNAALVAVVLQSGGLNRLSVKPSGSEDQNATVKYYLMIVLWSVAGLSAFKFVGAMWYKIHRIVSFNHKAPQTTHLLTF